MIVASSGQYKTSRDSRNAWSPVVCIKTAQNRSKDFDEVYWRVSAGLSYPVFKKLKVQLEGSFDAPFDHKRYNKPLLQLKGAVLYRF